MEHQLPTPYSQVGAGAVDMHCVAEDVFVEVIKVVEIVDEVMGFMVVVLLVDEELVWEVVEDVLEVVEEICVAVGVVE